jgi:hypothetical protein
LRDTQHNEHEQKHCKKNITLGIYAAVRSTRSYIRGDS